MKRIHYLAAEIFFYSYDNYSEHLGINERFDRLMPKDAKILDRALSDGCDLSSLASSLDVGEGDAEVLLERARDARKIVDAEDFAAGFREAVRQSIRHAMEDGLDTEESVEALAGQICYRAADLSYLLKSSGQRLENFSEKLRRE